MEDRNDAAQLRLQLGALVATPAALQYAEDHGIDLAALVFRHACGDWGDVDREDWKTNDEAVEHGYRVLSAYGPRDDRNVSGLWIITEADRSVTTVLRPCDY